MAYTNFQHCTANEYKNIIYNQETNNKIKILFNNVELEDADEYCESFEVVSRVIPNGSKIFMLENLVSQEATLVLHNIDTSIIQDQVSISIGTLVSENTYEYVPIGIYNLQEIPTTDNGKTTIKLRDNSVKLDFNYNAKPLIDEHGGTATKIQILQDICTKAGITCNVSSFIGSSDLIGIYDNTITGRQYVAYLAGSAGAIPIITRSGALDFKYLNNLSTIEIPIEIVEKYSNAENFKISRVVYEDATRKYESGNETYDTLFLDSANPYISSQEQVASIYNIVNNFNINSFTTGKILGNPAIDSYDLIQITDYDGTIFKTFANNTLRYNGKMINTFASEISFERKKENVSLKSGATFKKWAKTEIDNANAQITIQAGQIEEIEQDLANPTSTKQGKYFDLEDALDEPLIDFSLYGETQQASEPTPSSPQPIHNVSGDNTIEICGKNLLKENTLEIGSIDATTGQNSVNNTEFRTSGYIKVNSSTNYTLSNQNYLTYTNRGISEYDKNYNYIKRTNNTTISKSEGFTLQTTNTTKYIRVRYIVGSTISEVPTNMQLQLEANNQQTLYEAYTGNTQLISLGVENMFDKDNANVLPAYFSNNTISGGTKPKMLYISCLPNTTYTIQKRNDGNNNRFAVATTNETPALGVSVSGLITDHNASSISITTNTSSKYICVYYYTSDETTLTKQQILDTIQIEKGSQANSYSEYGKEPIELNKIGNYQDYIYKTDKWYLHKEIGKVVLNGSEGNWSRTARDGYYAFWLRNNTIGALTQKYQKYCDNFTYNSNDYGQAPIPSLCENDIQNNPSNFMFIFKTDGSQGTTIADFKSWLSTHNTIVYYVLATPTDIEITDTTLLEQLNNLMTLPLYKNMTHITLTPNDLQPTMKIEYYRDTSINENFVPKEDMTKYYTKTETNAQIKITGDSISSEVARVEDSVNDNNTYISRVETSVTNLQTDTNILLDFRQNVQQNGVEALRNTLIQADINGINITKGDKYKNLMTDRNQQIFSDNKEIMFMGYDDNLQKTVARIRELEARLITVGYHRTEMIQEDGENWTADYYVGGDN